MSSLNLIQYSPKDLKNMGPPRKVDANDDASEDVLQYLENFCFFIYLFFYRHDVDSKLQGHTFDPVKLTV